MISWNDRRKAKSPFGKAESYKVSENVTVKSPNDEPLDRKSLKGASQALMQNIDGKYTEPNKAEAKANARGLKAANSKTMFKVNKPMTRLFGGAVSVGHDVQVERGSKKEAKLQKKQDWSKSYGDAQLNKFNTKMKKAK
jgi:hypothetical protein